METSAWNFYFADDAPEKKAITRQFFEFLPDNRFDIYISEIVLEEIKKASDVKRTQLFQLIDDYQPTTLFLDSRVHELAKAYLENKVSYNELKDR
jgi:hypothetical protein